MNKKPHFIDFNFSTALSKNLRRLIKQIFLYYEQLHIITSRSGLLPLILFLKKHTLSLYKTLSDITVYDIPGKKYRFCIIYSLLSHIYNTRINVYTYTNESI